MFIARMYSWGSDDDCVGLDGIETCMGVFVAYNGLNTLFAIHVPACGDSGAMTGQQKLTQGRNSFVNYVRNQIPGFDGDNAKLFVVASIGGNRDFVTETFEYCQDFNIDFATFVRPGGKNKATLMRVTNDLTGARSLDGVAVLCLRDHARNIIFKYQKASQVRWTKASTTGANAVPEQRAGFFFNGGYIDNYSCSTSAAGGWTIATKENSIFETKLFFR